MANYFYNKFTKALPDYISTLSPHSLPSKSAPNRLYSTRFHFIRYHLISLSDRWNSARRRSFFLLLFLTNPPLCCCWTLPPQMVRFFGANSRLPLGPKLSVIFCFLPLVVVPRVQRAVLHTSIRLLASTALFVVDFVGASWSLYSWFWVRVVLVL
jgi:hypothetical protein